MVNRVVENLNAQNPVNCARGEWSPQTPPPRRSGSCVVCGRPPTRINSGDDGAPAPFPGKPGTWVQLKLVLVWQWLRRRFRFPFLMHEGVRVGMAADYVARFCLTAPEGDCETGRNLYVVKSRILVAKGPRMGNRGLPRRQGAREE